MTRTLRNKNEYFYYDLAAVIAGAVLFLCMYLTARYGVSDVDEVFYITIPQRILKGERLIVDEWNLSQFAMILKVPFYWLYTRLTGGTDGIVLATRCLFITYQIPIFSFIYIKLRRYKAMAVLAAVTFCGMVPQTMLSLSYFTVSTSAALIAALILFADKKEKKAPALVFTGTVIAFGIMAEPMLILAFGAWFIAVIAYEVCKNKNKIIFEKYGFVLNKRVFFWITVGAVLIFTAFMSFLGATGSLTALPEVLPYLFTGVEYNSENIIDIGRVFEALKYFGLIFPIGIALCLIAAFLYHFKKEKNKAHRKMIFVVACVFLAGSYILAGITTISSRNFLDSVQFCQSHNVPLIIFSLIPYLLREKKDERNFGILLIGLTYTLIVDISSAMMLSTGGAIVRVACLIDIAALIKELKEEALSDKKSFKKKSKKSLSPAKAILALCLAVSVLYNAGFFYVVAFYQPPEKLFMFSAEPRNCLLTSGPYKGLKTTERVKEIYENTIEDLDTIKENACGKAVTVMDLNAWMYIYLDLPYATFSSWYQEEWDRQYDYWRLMPEHEPGYIYIPFYECYFFNYLGDEYAEYKRDKTLTYVDGEATQGKAGYIIRVDKVVSDR